MRRAANIPPLCAFLALLFLALAVRPAGASGGDPGRLGRAVVPRSQNVELSLDPSRDDYVGLVEIRIDVREPVSSFRLHAVEMEIVGADLIGGTTAELAVEPGDASLVTLKAPGGVSPGKHTLTIAFRNDYDRKVRGLYKVDYKGDQYLFTQFEATEARYAFPCFDEPAFKIPWRLTLRVPPGLPAFTNTPESSRSHEGKWDRVVFERTPPMPSYLVALAVGPLDTLPIPDLSVPGRVITPRGMSHLAKDVARMTAPLLDALEEYFGRPYPYSKLDVVAVPEFWYGGMENAGFITYRDRNILFDSETASASQLRRLASIHAHEIAHQWFGDLVTMKWWDDMWLNESFATWMGTKIAQEVYPEYGFDVDLVRSAQDVMTSDAQVESWPVRTEVRSTDNVFQLTARGASYSKGGTVLGMFEAWVGEDRFREGVRRYISDHEWGNARAEDLWAALSEVAGVDLAGPMSTFIEQPGVPLVTVSRVGERSVELRQERFLNYGVERPEGGRPWSIPIVLRYGNSKRSGTRDVLLSEPSMVVPLPEDFDWIHPNAGEKGYYRWALSPGEVIDLAGRASEVLTVRERAGLPGHLSAMLRAGRLDGPSFLGACARLGGDPEPQVVNAVIRALGEVWVPFAARPGLHDAWAAYVRRTLDPAKSRFGLAPGEDDPEDVALLRPALVSWLGKHAHDPEVIEFARGVTERIVTAAGGVGNLDQTMIEICLEVAAQFGDRELFEKLRAGFEAASLPVERNMYVDALCSFRDTGLLEESIRLLFESDLPAPELLSGFRTLENGYWGRDILWDFVRENYDVIAARLPRNQMVTYLPHAADGCSSKRLESARSFFDRAGANFVSGQEIEFAKVEESVATCVGLAEREGEAVAAYLRRVEK